MSADIRSQRIARAAFQQVEGRGHQPNPDKYLAFARTFPTLVHTSGLAQAAAFALAKKEEKLEVLDDLAQVIHAADDEWQFVDGRALDAKARCSETDVWTYMRLTRQALQSATWIKRYSEALLSVKAPAQPSGDDVKDGEGDMPKAAMKD